MQASSLNNGPWRRIAAQPELFDELLAFFVGGETLESLPLFIGDDVADIDIQPVAIRGFEFAPIQRKVQIGPGETSLSLDLERQTDVAAEGWYSGDVHVHANYTNHEFIMPEDIRDQLEAEDLNFANLMVANSEGADVHDEQYFEGRPHRFSTGIPSPCINPRVYAPNRCCRGTNASPW